MMQILLSAARTMRFRRSTSAVMMVALASIAVPASVVVAQTESRRFTQTPAGNQVEEVLVTGEHPGPGMWKVTKGEHSLWILGTHSPLPQRLIWRSQDVELAISEAQQVLGSYSAAFTLRGGNPLAMKGKPLRKLLPRRAYSQWQALKKKYIGRNDDIETALPVTAALVLRSSAFARAGLANADAVQYELQRMANAYQVPVTTAHQVTKVISGIPVDADAERKGIAFLVATMNSLEADVRTARLRANAWAIGDIDALRTQASADTTTAQLYASSWPYLSDEELAALSKETDQRWVDAAARALERNQTTVATLPIFMLLRPDGLLAQLRNRGFEVIEPVH